MAAQRSRRVLLVARSAGASALADRIRAATGWDVTAAHQLRMARTLLAPRRWRAVLCEAQLSDGAGAAFLDEAKQLDPTIRTVLLGSPPPGASAVDACAPWPLAIEPALAAVLQALGTEDRTIVAAPTPPQPLPPSATPQPFLPPARALPRLATPAVGARRWQTPIQPGKDRK